METIHWTISSWGCERRRKGDSLHLWAIPPVSSSRLRCPLTPSGVDRGQPAARHPVLFTEADNHAEKRLWQPWQTCPGAQAEWVAMAKVVRPAEFFGLIYYILLDIFSWVWLCIVDGRGSVAVTHPHTKHNTDIGDHLLTTAHTSLRNPSLAI